MIPRIPHPMTPTNNLIHPLTPIPSQLHVLPINTRRLTRPMPNPHLHTLPIPIPSPLSPPPLPQLLDRTSHILPTNRLKQELASYLPRIAPLVRQPLGYLLQTLNHTRQTRPDQMSLCIRWPLPQSQRPNHAQLRIQFPRGIRVNRKRTPSLRGVHIDQARIATPNHNDKRRDGQTQQIRRRKRRRQGPEVTLTVLSPPSQSVINHTTGGVIGEYTYTTVKMPNKHKQHPPRHMPPRVQRPKRVRLSIAVQHNVVVNLLQRRQRRKGVVRRDVFGKVEGVGRVNVGC